MLLKLPEELISLVIEELAADPFGNSIQDPTSLIPLSLTCRKLRGLCMPILAQRLDLDRRFPSTLTFTTQWLKSVKCLRCHPKGDIPLIKIVEDGHVIMTGNSTSLINPRLCPLLSRVELSVNQGSLRLNEVLRSLDAYGNSFPNYNHIGLCIRAQFSDLDYLASLKLSSRERVKRLDIEIIGKIFKQDYPPLKSFPNLETVAIFRSKTLRNGGSSKRRNGYEEIDASSVKYQLSLIGNSLLELEKLNHFEDYDASSIDLYIPSSVTSMNISFHTVIGCCFSNPPSYPEFTNLTELTMEMWHSSLGTIKYHRNALAGTNIDRLLASSKPKLRTLKVIVHLQDSEIVVAGIKLVLSYCPGIVLDRLVISYPSCLNSVDSLLGLLRERSIKTRNLMLLCRQSSYNYDDDEDEYGEDKHFDDGPIVKHLASETILQKIVVAGYNEEWLNASNAFKIHILGRFCKGPSNMQFSRNKKDKGMAIYNYVGPVPQSYLKLAQKEALGNPGTSASLSFEGKLWCENDDKPLPKFYQEFTKGTDQEL